MYIPSYALGLVARKGNCERMKRIDGSSREVECKAHGLASVTGVAGHVFFCNIEPACDQSSCNTSTNLGQEQV